MQVSECSELSTPLLKVRLHSFGPLIRGHFNAWEHTMLLFRILQCLSKSFFPLLCQVERFSTFGSGAVLKRGARHAI